jgi:uncharacterized membrane protein HdeD (DUF308 family)
MASYPADELAAEAKETAQAVEVVRYVSRFWWLWLVTGTIWVVAALVVLQFDKASVTTVGVIVGLMFLFGAVEQVMLAGVSEGARRWLAVGFGVLLAVAGIVALINPKNTFAGIADILGFLFLIVAASWIVQALMDRETNDLWWLGLISGIFMFILAFWTAGQFFIQKAYLLLVFAGIWALMRGVNDIVHGFQARRVHDALE